MQEGCFSPPAPEPLAVPAGCRQLESFEKGMVDAAGGGVTWTCSPQWESVTVSRAPPVAVVISSTGRVAPPAERVSVFVNFGAELVAAVAHFKEYTPFPEAEGADSVVPLAAGKTPATEETVIEPATPVYWLVPALSDTQSEPSWLTSAALNPTTLVSPDELPDR